MPLKFEIEKLTDLMKDFYILTGIRIVLFDESYAEIISYPESGIPFCSYMRQNQEFDKLCRKSDKISFEKCKKTQALNMYQCHAGLIEATVPIISCGSIIGYIMFGQIADKKHKKDFLDNAACIYKQYNMESMPDMIDRIKYKSNIQLVAAAHILETCTSYILQKELVKPSRIQLFNTIDNYISENIHEDISVEKLCVKFNISRTRLYAAMRPYVNGGIAQYIRKKRLLKAEELLKTTDMSVFEICEHIGFADYNYFLRVFKKQYGISPKKMRN